MSILVVEVVSEGLIFAADRNITVTMPDGATTQPEGRPKVVPWPRQDVLLGYVGAASLTGQPVPDWLEDRRQTFAPMTSLEEIARGLATQVELQRGVDEGSAAPKPMYRGPALDLTPLHQLVAFSALLEHCSVVVSRIQFLCA